MGLEDFLHFSNVRFLSISMIFLNSPRSASYSSFTVGNGPPRFSTFLQCAIPIGFLQWEIDVHDFPDFPKVRFLLFFYSRKWASKLFYISPRSDSYWFLQWGKSIPMIFLNSPRSYSYSFFTLGNGPPRFSTFLQGAIPIGFLQWGNRFP